MAIESSRLAVYAGSRAANEPLFRYEHVRDPDGPIPTAHLQVHAHRDAFTHAQTSAGKRTKRVAWRSEGPTTGRSSVLSTSR